jgi:hypothetical protein
METLRIYKDLEVTYLEFEQALIQLGYTKVVKSNGLFYVHKKYDSIVKVSNLVKPEMKMLKADFTAQAFLMEMKGVSNDKDDIAKMIEHSRLNSSIENRNA